MKLFSIGSTELSHQNANRVTKVFSNKLSETSVTKALKYFSDN